MADQKDKKELGEQPDVSPKEHKEAKAQAEQMFGKLASHVPDVPQRADLIPGKPPTTAPAAQGPNISKEQAEFAVNAAKNSNAENPSEFLTPAPTQISDEPLTEAGKAPKED